MSGVPSARLRRLPVGAKIVFLLSTSTAVLLISDWRPLVAFLVFVLVCGLLVRAPLSAVTATLRSLLYAVIAVCVAQYALVGLQVALLSALRLVTIGLTAALITLTIKTSDLLAAMERWLSPLRMVGIDPGPLALALSMTLRFLPLIANITREVREAQRCRGLEGSVLAVAVPSLVRMLKMADNISDALEARSGHSTRK